MKAELALALFQRERLTLGQAALLAGLPQLDFQRLLASRQIPLHYGLEEMEQDLERAKRLPGAWIVVSDTSPILNLAAVDKLRLLRDLYTEIVVPPAVQRELVRNGRPQVDACGRSPRPD